MGIYNKGWIAVQKSSTPSQPSPKKSSSKSESGIFFGVVIELLNSPKKPQGTIGYSSLLNKTPGEASPLFSNDNYYPIAGEMVLIFTLPDTEYNKPGETSPFEEPIRTFYIGGINIWDNPSFNGVSSTDQITNPTNPNYFNPNNGARSTKSFIGDKSIEGRFGNSIRLGGSYNTPWKSSNSNDPITIISNGTLNSTSPYIIENPDKDLSSIYLTSKQKIPFSIANENFLSSSYSNGTSPTTPSLYINPQIILNSDRIVLNAKKDSVLISGQKSVGLSSNDSVNIGAKQIYIDGSDIRLGSKDAEEPVLLGNKTITTLRQITSLLKSITMVLQLDQLFPAGIPIPNGPANTIALTANQILSNIETSLDSLASKKVKTK
jgi:hypothetical protein